MERVPAPIKKHRRLAASCAATLALVLTAPVAPVAPVAAKPTGGCDGRDRREIWDLNLSVEAKVAEYAVGDVARVVVTVTRPDDYDPLTGQTYIGEPPMSEPVADATVGAGVVVEGVYLTGYGVTDQEGKVVLPIKIERWTPPGVGMGSFLATRVVVDIPCLLVEEIGAAADPALFKVKRQP